MASNLVNASIVMYISFTFLFFVVKFRFFPENTGLIWILTFLVITCVLQIVQNVTLTSSPAMCGKPDIKLAIVSTVIPWVIIFALFTIAITAIPGWIRIFSNTFGVFAAESFGLKERVNKVFVLPDKKDEKNIDYLKMLDNIYTDRMALVLELNIDKVKTGAEFEWPEIVQLVKLNYIKGSMEGDKYKPTDDDIKNQKDLYSALLLRENVGYFFWFLLIGIFCILVSTNTLLASNCSPSVVANQYKIFK